MASIINASTARSMSIVEDERENLNDKIIRAARSGGDYVYVEYMVDAEYPEIDMEYYESDIEILKKSGYYVNYTDEGNTEKYKRVYISWGLKSQQIRD